MSKVAINVDAGLKERLANPGKEYAFGMIREHERVVLTARVPNERLEIGDVGTVVHVYADGMAFEIEFRTLDGQTAAVATVEACSVRPSRVERLRIRESCGFVTKRSRSANSVQTIGLIAPSAERPQDDALSRPPDSPSRDTHSGPSRPSRDRSCHRTMWMIGNLGSIAGGPRPIDETSSRQRVTDAVSTSPLRARLISSGKALA